MSDLSCLQDQLLGSLLLEGVSAMCQAQDNNVYMGGVFNTVASETTIAQNFAMWNGSVWESVPIVAPNVTIGWSESTNTPHEHFLGAVMTMVSLCCVPPAAQTVS
jgi:hypothetical protein